MDFNKIADWVDKAEPSLPVDVEEVGTTSTVEEDSSAAVLSDPSRPSSSSSCSSEHREAIVLPLDVDEPTTPPATTEALMETEQMMKQAQEELERIMIHQEAEEEWTRLQFGFSKVRDRGGFVNPSDRPKTMSDLVLTGRYYAALMGYVDTPGEFYLNPCETWNTLEKLMADMQKEFADIQEVNRREKTSISIPWKGHLVPGFIGAVLFNGEFHRAKIISILPDEKFKVQLFDYGDIRSVSINDIRYLRRHLLYKLPAQAIRCKVRYRNLDADQPWKKEEGDLLRKLSNNKPHVVHFKLPFLIDGEQAWEVYLHLFDQKTDRIGQFHIERQVLFQHQRVLNQRDRNQTDSDKNVVLANFSNLLHYDVDDSQFCPKLSVYM